MAYLGKLCQKSIFLLWYPTISLKMNIPVTKWKDYLVQRRACIKGLEYIKEKKREGAEDKLNDNTQHELQTAAMKKITGS